MLAMGFEILTERQVQTGYVGDHANMMKTVYDCVLFTARKPGSSEDSKGETTGASTGAKSAESGAGASPGAAVRQSNVLWSPADATRSLQLSLLPPPVKPQPPEKAVGLQQGESEAEA